MEFSLISDVYKQILNEFSENTASDPRFYFISDITANGQVCGTIIRTLNTAVIRHYHTGAYAGWSSVSGKIFKQLDTSNTFCNTVFEDEQCYIQFASVDDVKLLLSQIFRLITKNIKPEFDCCHLFRQCSDAKRCVNPHNNTSIFCGYRKKIESGTIFYGKNSADFDGQVYQSFLDWVHSLPNDTYAIFISLLHSFVTLRSPKHPEVIYGTVIYSARLVEFVPACHREILSYVFNFHDPVLHVLKDKALYPLQRLRGLVRAAKENITYYADAPEDAINQTLGGKGATSENFIRYIIKYCPDEISAIRSKYSYVYVNRDLTRYINEYLHDNPLF